MCPCIQQRCGPVEPSHSPESHSRFDTAIQHRQQRLATICQPYWTMSCNYGLLLTYVRMMALENEIKAHASPAIVTLHLRGMR